MCVTINLGDKFMTNPKDKNIVTAQSLQKFFFESLSKLNGKMANPLPDEAIFYSSDVLDRYCLSQDYFENIDGKIQEKVLGIKMLEASHKTRAEQEKIYRDVAETTLILCGCFSPSVEKKMVGWDYYSSLGKMAFNQMNFYRPSFMDMPSFFEFMSKSFESVTGLLALMGKYNSPAKLIEGALTEQEAALLGVTLVAQDKVS